MNNWIKCSERMPPDFHEVLFYLEIHDEHSGCVVKRDIVAGHYADGIWHICQLYLSMKLNDKVIVTHWQELPGYPE